MSRHDGERGIALIVVLWTLLLLAVIAGSLAAQSRREGFLARNAVTLAKIEASADGGVVRGIAALIDQRVDFRWKADSNPHRYMLDGIEVVITITDEAGKVDLNVGSPELLAAVLKVVGATEAEAVDISVSVVRERGGGQKGRGGFETVADLMHIPGMNRALFGRVEQLVTVFTHAGGVDPSVAPPEVLMALAGGNTAALDAASPGAAGSDVGTATLSSVAGPISESQHAIYAIKSIATLGRASSSRQAFLRLTHSVDIPFLLHG